MSTHLSRRRSFIGKLGGLSPMDNLNHVPRRDDPYAQMNATARWLAMEEANKAHQETLQDKDERGAIVEYDPRDYETPLERRVRIEFAEERVDRAWEANHAAAPHSWA